MDVAAGRRHSASAWPALTRVRVEGAIDEIPRDGPVIIAANHASNLDVPVLGSSLMPRIGRRFQWLGKRELFAWPVVGWVAARRRRASRSTAWAADVEAFRLAKRHPRRGPRRCSSSRRARAAATVALQEARDGVAVLALRTGAPIVPVGDRRLVRALAARPEAAAPRRPRHGPRRLPVPPRRRAPARASTGEPPRPARPT